MVCHDLTLVMKKDHILIRMQPYDPVVLMLILQWVLMVVIIFTQEVVVVGVPRALRILYAFDIFISVLVCISFTVIVSINIIGCVTQAILLMDEFFYTITNLIDFFALAKFRMVDVFLNIMVPK
jgi:hypothetical protein